MSVGARPFSRKTKKRGGKGKRLESKPDKAEPDQQNQNNKTTTNKMMNKVILSVAALLSLSAKATATVGGATPGALAGSALLGDGGHPHFDDECLSGGIQESCEGMLVDARICEVANAAHCVAVVRPGAFIDTTAQFPPGYLTALSVAYKQILTVVVPAAEVTDSNVLVMARIHSVGNFRRFDEPPASPGASFAVLPEILSDEYFVVEGLVDESVGVSRVVDTHLYTAGHGDMIVGVQCVDVGGCVMEMITDFLIVPTAAPTAAPTSAAPTAAPTSAAPTAAPTSSAPTSSAPTSSAPTSSAPTSSAPTSSSSLAPPDSPSASPTPLNTASPTGAPTSTAAASGGGEAEGVPVGLIAGGAVALLCAVAAVVAVKASKSKAAHAAQGTKVSSNSFELL
jgi:hypothetical protein